MKEKIIESEEIELKQSISELSKALVAMGAMLNKNGKGTIYFGITDDGEKVGIDLGKRVDTLIRSKVKEEIDPSVINICISKEKLKSNKYILKLEFFGDQKLYSVRKKYYIRQGNENIQMSQDELVKRVIHGNYSRWENGISNETLDDIDEEALKKFYELGLKSKRLSEEKYNKQVLLKKLHLMFDEKHLNNAGKLLFSKNEPITIKFAVFASSDKTEFIDEKRIESNIFNLILKSISYIKQNTHTPLKLGGILAVSESEIPEIALREIIVNSFAHADYANFFCVHEIVIYSDKVTIFNPGGFIEKYTPKEYIENSLPSYSRNQTILSALYKSGLIDSWGTGFKKTHQVCTENKIRYDYKIDENGFTFIFYRKNITIKHDEKSKNKNELSIDQQIILLIQKNPKITENKMVDKIKKSKRTIEYYLQKLTKARTIMREGSKKTGNWKILKNKIDK